MQVNPVLLASVLLRVAGTVYALVLLYRSGDRRFAFLTVMIGLMTTRQVWTELAVTTTGLAELPGLGVSVLAIATVHYLSAYVEEEEAVKARLREANEGLRRFRRAVEQAADAIFITDTDGTIDYANPAFETLTGYAPAEAVGRNPRILKSGEMGDEYYEAMWGTILDGEVWEAEIVNERRSGERYFAEQTVAPVTDEEGDVCEFVAVQRDVTERKAFEDELQDREAHLEQAQAIANLGSWQFDVQNDDLEWSDEVYRIFETPREEPMTFEKFLEYVHPEDREAVEEQWDAALEGDPYDLEHRIEVYGEVKWVHEKAELEFDEAGRPQRAIGVVQDVTDRKERTRQLRVLDRILRHNLRNEMQLIQGYVERIQRAATDDEVAANAAAIVEAIERLLVTVDKEREIVEVLSEPPERTAIDAADVARRVVDAAREYHPDAEVELDVPEAAPVAASGELERALDELVENAVAHSDRRDPTVAVDVEPGPARTRIVVADDGPGIPDQEVSVLTGDREIESLYHGSGLGLWLAYWVVRRLDGTVSFDENEPRGCVVTIELPTAG